MIFKFYLKKKKMQILMPTIDRIVNNLQVLYKKGEIEYKISGLKLFGN